MSSILDSDTKRTAAAAAPAETGADGDAILIERCCQGNQESWAELIHKYRNLIFSIPIKYGFSRDDANEIFQEVCLTLLSQLSTVREPRTFAAWLIRVTARQCFHWRSRQNRRSRIESGQYCPNPILPEIPGAMLLELEREQNIREAVRSMPDRCRELLMMLFLASPPVPYDEVARSLGVASGSVACLRMRCLQRLRLLLEERGIA